MSTPLGCANGRRYAAPAVLLRGRMPARSIMASVANSSNVGRNKQAKATGRTSVAFRTFVTLGLLLNAISSPRRRFFWPHRACRQRNDRIGQVHALLGHLAGLRPLRTPQHGRIAWKCHFPPSPGKPGRGILASQVEHRDLPERYTHATRRQGILPLLPHRPA